MKEKLMAAWAKVSPWIQKAYAWSPFVCGIVVGHFGWPIAKLAINCAAGLVKAIVG